MYCVLFYFLGLWKIVWHSPLAFLFLRSVEEITLYICYFIHLVCHFCLLTVLHFPLLSSIFFNNFHTKRFYNVEQAFFLSWAYTLTKCYYIQYLSVKWEILAVLRNLLSQITEATSQILRFVNFTFFISKIAKHLLSLYNRFVKKEVYYMVKYVMTFDGI